MEKNEPIRIQKYLSAKGICSRRQAEGFILAGDVTVNGVKAGLGDKVIPGKDRVALCGELIEQGAKHETYRYLVLYKPRGVVTTMHDEAGRKCVADLIGEIPERVYPVGRLDRDSEGMLILTNDGDLAYTLTHPRHEINKEYTLVVRGQVSEDQLGMLSSAMMIDAYQIHPAKIEVRQVKKDRTVLDVIIHEGRNRQIRRMCEQAGLEVLRLKRVCIGQVRLGRISSGQWREMTDSELSYLKGLHVPSAPAKGE